MPRELRLEYHEPFRGRQSTSRIQFPLSHEKQRVFPLPDPIHHPNQSI